MHTWLTSLLFLFCVRAGTVGKAQVPASYFSDFPLFFFLKMKSCFFFRLSFEKSFFLSSTMAIVSQNCSVSIGCCWVFHGFTEFYRVLPSFTGFYRVLPANNRVKTECSENIRAKSCFFFSKKNSEKRAKKKRKVRKIHSF